jgi:chromosome segregation ATPase
LSFLKKRHDEEVDPLDDIIEGVDIIGTMINEMLPQIADDLADLRERLGKTAGEAALEQSPVQDTAAEVADLSERLELLEQRFLAHEQTSLDRHTDLKEELDELRMSLGSLHDKLDDLTSRLEETEG